MKKNTTKKEKKPEKIVGYTPPLETEQPKAAYHSRKVVGTNLAHLGLIENDLLIIRETDVIDEDKLTIWRTPNGITCKFAYVNFDDITIHNKNGWMERHPAKDMELLGVVESIQRSWENLEAQNNE